MKSQNQYESKRDEILAILENKNLSIGEKFDRLQIAELIQDTDIYQAELVAQNQELLDKEQQLISSRVNFETLFNFAPIAYFKLDEKYNIEKYNTTANTMFGHINLGSYTIKPFTLLLESGEILNFINLQNTLKNENFGNGIFHFRSQNGLIGRVDITKYNDSFFLSIIDVTHEKKQEAMILSQAKNSAMGEMVSMITHQWKQPLSVVSILNTSMDLELEMGLEDKDKFLKYNTQIKEQIEYMAETIDDFKEYFDENRKKEIQNVTNCVQRAKKFTLHALNKNDIQLYIHFLDDGDYEILSFKHDVCQVLMNIINNAKDEFVKSNKSEERFIILDIFHDEGNIVLNIKNNAGHIPSEIIDFIFHPNVTTKKESGGSGIGLYIAEKIVREHLEGTISVKNLEDKESVLFTLTVPLINNKKKNKEK
jgi:signal transduction histidine kinase